MGTSALSLVEFYTSCTVWVTLGGLAGEALADSCVVEHAGVSCLPRRELYGSRCFCPNQPRAALRPGNCDSPRSSGKWNEPGCAVGEALSRPTAHWPVGSWGVMLRLWKEPRTLHYFRKLADGKACSPKSTCWINNRLISCAEAGRLVDYGMEQYCSLQGGRTR